MLSGADCSYHTCLNSGQCSPPFQTVRYEGYGPGDAAVLIDCVTQDRDRTAGELRRLFATHGGHLGAQGSVAYLFNEIGLLTYMPGGPAEARSGDAGLVAEFARQALAVGAEDVRMREDAVLEVITDPEDFAAVRAALAGAGYTALTALITQRAATVVDLRGELAGAMRGLLEGLSREVSVQGIYTNARLADERLAPV